MADAEIQPVSSKEVARYFEDGFLAVPNLFAADEMLAWKRCAEKAGAVCGEGATTGVTVWMAPRLPAYLRDRMANPRVVAILRQLVGENIEFLSAKTVVKNRSITHGSPWHRDWEYWGGATKTTMWFALDGADADNGCLRVVPGSHRRCFVSRFHENATEGFGHRIEASDLDGLPVIDLAVAPGTAVFFSDRIVHSSFSNTVGRDRWSFIATYRDAGVVDDSNLWETAWVLAGRSVNVVSDGDLDEVST